jgi:hypothetical protein
LPQQLGLPPLLARLAFLPSALLAAVGNLISGPVTNRYGARVPIVAPDLDGGRTRRVCAHGAAGIAATHDTVDHGSAPAARSPCRRPLAWYSPMWRADQAGASRQCSLARSQDWVGKASSTATGKHRAHVARQDQQPAFAFVG